MANNSVANAGVAWYVDSTGQQRALEGNGPASKLAVTGTGAVKAAPGDYWGYVITTNIATGVITVYDNASAASGTVIDVIPVSGTAGQKSIGPVVIPCANGIYASFAGTGTVLFLFT